MSRFPVEPWNTITIFAFLIVGLIFLRRTRMQFRRYPAVVAAIPVLLVGFVGGAMYHATRSSNFWLKLDFMPIFLLAVGGACFLWYRVFATQKRVFVAGAIASIVLIVIFLQLPVSTATRQVRISLSYVILALVVLLPAYLRCAIDSWRHLRWILLASIFFSIAVTFRVSDFRPEIIQIFPMGTHFLWHLFGAATAYCMLNYLMLEADSRSK